jgi:predicted nucleic acid-binding protein
MEVGNGLLMAERRGRITIKEIESAWLELDAMSIETDLDTLTHASRGTAALARKQQLTLDDAAYLELALRLVLPIATFDAPLGRAAEAEGVELVTP